ncbi:MAG: 50S ribosomal protein L27 [Minisyncoccia bacterium]
MAHKKSAGTTKNGRDSNPKYLGVKLSPGSRTKVGSVIIRQRGTDILPGKNVGMGKDHTLFALISGVVKLGYKRKMHFNNKVILKKIVHVLPA